MTGTQTQQDPNGAAAGEERAALEQQFQEARQTILRGRKDLVEGHRLMRELSEKVRAARARGSILQQIWECERMTGRRVQYFSQAGQDAFLDEAVFRGKRGGTFVEIGGYDGITGSNCLFFELMRGWSGLLVEPSPTYHKMAAEFRRCTCLRLAVGQDAGKAEFLEVTRGLTQMGGLLATYEPSLREKVETDPRHEGEIISVRTRTLAQILDSAYLSEIDYISLDVEGAELAILSDFPFDKYRIQAWTIENNGASNDVPELMRTKGYKLIEALGVDDVYVFQGHAEV
ncbi:MAG: FkbM family methyltransferase [Pseudomonadota bacterium]